MSIASDRYDTIVVGARCAGAATAMLLARSGQRVLVVDRSPYGGDTLSTHALMRGGVLQLHRWGLLERIVAAGTPPIRRTVFDYGHEVVDVTIKPRDGVDALYAPRRTVLDRVLVDAALEAGAEFCFGVTVTGLRRDATGAVTGIEGRDARGRPVATGAALTVGADGIRSTVAARVGAPVERRGQGATAVIYRYVAGVASDAYEWHYRPGLVGGIIPTNGGDACIFAGTTPQRFRPMRGDVGRGMDDILTAVDPRLAARVAGGRPASAVRSFPGVPAHLRTAHGPGWALVGDAGYFKDPITAHGITDALRDAELLSRAIIAGRDLAAYQAERDALSHALFSASDAVASYAWSGQEAPALVRAMSAAMNAEVDALLALEPAPARA
jgi:flavin-dependent dehydrogenase